MRKLSHLLSFLIPPKSWWIFYTNHLSAELMFHWRAVLSLLVIVAHEERRSLARGLLKGGHTRAMRLANREGDGKVLASVRRRVRSLVFGGGRSIYF